MTVNFADGALTLDMRDDLAVLTLNRPEKRNALSQAVWRALPEAAALVESTPSVKVLLVTGAGGHFAAGADISEFEQAYATRDSTAAYARDMGNGCDAMANLSKPVIAWIRGVCVGGACSLALACDMRIAGADARLGITPGKLGLIYTLGDTKRLVDAVGPSAAKNILFTGAIITAEQALRIGLVDEVHPAEETEAAVFAKARAIAATSQWSARKTKAIVQLILNGATADTQATRDWFVDATEQADFIEGRDAFLSKRPPVFPFR
jgi:enoyl-CoA hydratase/carnithine racemase